MKSISFPSDPNIEKTTKKEKNIFSSTLSEYCSNTSIHGIGYVGAEDKSIIEKSWWVIVFVLSVLSCGYLISQTYTKWQENPVIVSFSQKQTPIWEIPFPAVTICPVNKVQQWVYNYTEAYQKREKLTGMAHKQFWDVSLICNLQWIIGGSEKSANKTTDKMAVDYIKKVAPQLDDTIIYIMWQNKEYYVPEKLFGPQLTEEGLCFTFNSFNHNDMYTDEQDSSIKIIEHERRNKEWSIEYGYPEDANMTTYPMRTSQDGLKSGLRIRLHSLKFNKEYACGNPTSGYKVLLHNPAETPRVAEQYILAPLKRQTTVSVTPKMITTSRGLSNIPSETRSCYFSHEKSLRFYKVYTQENCRMECDSNFTKAICNCVPFYMARDAETPICGYGSMDCIERAKDKYIEFEMMKTRNKINEEIESTPEYQIYLNCNCMPSCAHLKYSAETSQAQFHFLESVKATLLEDDIESISMLEATQLDIFFKETQFLALHRSELYGNTDFLANCGGLLGLFMGFSFLSLLEIIYYVTLRLWCRMKKQK